MEDRDTKKRLNEWHTALKSERSSWLETWDSIATHMRPRGFRRDTMDYDGDEKHQDIINSTPLDSARVLASGMMAGITSPSRPWYRLTMQGEPELSERPAVKRWLSEVERRLRQAMAKSNLYKALFLIYADLGPFGVAAASIEEDVEDGVRVYVFPVGSYCLATSSRGAVDTLFREESMTCKQVVDLFGEENCSKRVQDWNREGKHTQRLDVVHCVWPNDDYKEGAVGTAGKKFLSYWWEASSNEEDGFLRKAGYHEFPIVAPRWETVAADAYGHGPGWAALGDCRALQLYERRSAQAVDKVVNPPMAAPTGAASGVISLLPGEVSFVDALGAGQALRPAVTVDPRAVEVFEMKIQRHEERIRRAFFADLWLMLSQSEGQMTAREVSERREEKLLQLGTVLEALNDELLDPVIDRFFAILLRAGQIPPPPEELQGVELKVEYISIMAQAQKLLSTTGLERISAFVGNLSQLSPSVLDKLDVDQLVDEYADSLGVPPAVVRPDEEVEAMRASRAQQQAQQQALEQATGAADVAKKLGDTSLESGNALSEMLKGVGAR
jgi:hypothetical protein